MYSYTRRSSYGSSNKGLYIFVAALATLFVIIGGFMFWHYEYGTERSVTFTVRSLDDQTTYNGKYGSGHQYLIFTTDGQVYKNTDSWMHGKTDSSNVQAMFTVGDTYTCPIYGFRVFWMSSYPDILDGCKLVSKS